MSSSSRTSTMWNNMVRHAVSTFSWPADFLDCTASPSWCHERSESTLSCLHKQRLYHTSYGWWSTEGPGKHNGFVSWRSWSQWIMADLVLNRLRLKGLRVKKQTERCSPVFYTPVSSFSENKQSPKKVTVRELELNLSALDVCTRQSETHLLDWAAEEDELRTSFLDDKEEEEEEEEMDFEGRKIEQWEALDKFNLNEKHKGFIHMLCSTKFLQSSQSKEP